MRAAIGREGAFALYRQIQSKYLSWCHHSGAFSEAEEVLLSLTAHLDVASAAFLAKCL